MKKVSIKLGRKMGPMPAGIPEPESESEEIYPSLFLEWEKPYELPEEGTMTIRYKTVSKSASKRKGSEPRYTMELEIKEIVDVEESESKKDDMNGEQALDKLAKECNCAD